MRHQKSGRQLGRNSSHRKAMWSNMVASLITHERIETTEAKAKELRRIAERTMTWATSLGTLLSKDPGDRSQQEAAKYVHHVRMAKRVLRDKSALDRLFTEVAPRFVNDKGEYDGGYTRVIKTRNRKGDGAPLAFVELIDYEVGAAKAESTSKEETAAE
jgi:large subunit ribosomal protein L17